MDLAHKNNLRYCRTKIVEDLNVNDIIDHLIENSIVDDETHEKIMSEKTRRAQVGMSKCQFLNLTKTRMNIDMRHRKVSIYLRMVMKRQLSKEKNFEIDFLDL